MSVKTMLKDLFLRIRGEVSTKQLLRRGMKIGKNFHRMNGCWIDPGHCWLISFGDNVTIAPRATILAHDASLQHGIKATRIGKVSIGNNVFIGAGSLILPGVNVGDNVIIGAGSVVTKDVLSDSIVCGCPAKRVGSYADYLSRNKETMQTAPIYGEEYTLGKIT